MSLPERVYGHSLTTRYPGVRRLVHYIWQKGRLRNMSPEQAHVLVVEDNDLLQEMLTELLMDKEGRTVTVVSSGADALAYLNTVRPRLILLDIKLSGLDGLAVYRLIRARAEVATVPMLFLSGLNDAELAEQIDKPKRPYRRLNKPFKICDFDAVIDDLLAESIP